ncbi:MAG TPA: low specificity L-threonine aldolase [Clostridiales bacterium]|nr:low specificity L-threonine aldolase [Clostridiales bacterium]
MSRYKRSFASDNNAIVHPDIMKALQEANNCHVLSYGDDPFTQSAAERFKEVFGQNSEVFFVYNGTGANVTGLGAITMPYQAVICTDSSHIYVDECGAAERFIGCRLIPIPTEDGKLRPGQIQPLLHVLGEQHHSQPAVISITQSTEMGTVYKTEELKALTDFAHSNNLLVHMDGARIANAAAFLGTSLKALTADAGIDVLSFGGTKNGLMFGEAVVFFNEKLAQNYKYIRKQGTQLASKMRYIAVQFEALLTNQLWLENARKANDMAALLANEVKGIPGIRITQPVEANGVFVSMPVAAAEKLRQEYFFYPWNTDKNEYRWMTSFDMEEDDIMEFVEAVKKAMKAL